MESKEKFGKKIKELREQKGMTVKQLADRSDLSVMQINLVENGAHNPNVITIAKLSQALGESYDELYNIARGIK